MNSILIVVMRGGSIYKWCGWKKMQSQESRGWKDHPKWGKCIFLNKAKGKKRCVLLNFYCFWLPFVMYGLCFSEFEGGKCPIYELTSNQIIVLQYNKIRRLDWTSTQNMGHYPDSKIEPICSFPFCACLSQFC